MPLPQRGAALHRDLADEPAVQLGCDRVARDERDAQARARGLTDRPVRADRERPRVEPFAARNSSLTARVPEPGSRRSQVRPSRSEGVTRPAATRGSSGAPISTSSLASTGDDSTRSSSGGRLTNAVGRVVGDHVEHAPAVADAQRQSDAGMRLGERAHERRDERLGGGGHRRDVQLALAQRSGLERGARAPLQQADHVAGKRREGRAGGGGADAAPVALEQCRAHLTRQRGDSGRNGRLGDDELVAAFVTEPVRTTARKLRSCVSVMDTTEDKL
jgi:hypothetical protein